ncbi:MAG: electron transport complex subunit RsxC [Bacteroidales bacterium]|nr:electron transport complex subunit RsxC [Bacteroidales bacterium]
MKKTFKIGGTHPKDSKLSSEISIETLPLSEKVYISMAQHLGAPATPVVAKGDKVLVGQVIGEPAGFISGYVHSSVSGTVADVVPMPDLAGNMVMHVAIDVEGDEWDPAIDRTDKIVTETSGTPEQLIAQIKAAGVVGMGGATFPTHVKLAPPKDKKAEYLILNGAECEPYVTADDRIMRELPKQIVIGARIMMRALSVEKCFIAIEENKPAAIDAMTKAAASFVGIEVLKMKKKYPQGGEKQLIDAITSRQVPSGALPIDTGCVVQNVATALAVYEAVQKNKPLFERVMTVTGDCLQNRKNFRVRIGTPLNDILAAVGGAPVEGNMKYISGGPMMGKAIVNLNATTQKGSSCLLMLTEKQTLRKSESNCIRCGKCAEACPMGLEPWLLNKLARVGGRYDDLEQNHIADCIECGCCLYTCPANIPLLDIIRINKAEVMKIIRARQAK